MLVDNYAKVFILMLGGLFFVLAIVVSLLFELHNVIAVGMAIIGIFLIILPLTYQKGQPPLE